MLGALHTVAAAGCECLAHAANRHAGLPESLAPVIVRLWDAVKAARSGFASGDRCLTGVGLIYLRARVLHYSSVLVCGVWGTGPVLGAIGEILGWGRLVLMQKTRR